VRLQVEATTRSNTLEEIDLRDLAPATHSAPRRNIFSTCNDIPETRGDSSSAGCRALVIVDI
jgi:hypothetical protein